jgi:putative phosphoserine phosphatase/1-acylglycerol-3-phosphate O-acyltransferase
MHTRNTIAAFFDLDHTLLARSSGELYVRTLRELGLLRTKDLLEIIAASCMYRIGFLDPERLMDRFASRYKDMLETEMIEFCTNWFNETVKGFLYRDALAKVREHVRAGHVVSLLTAATNYVAEPTRTFLSIPHAICTRLEVENGRFTGRILKPVCHGTGKLYWAERFCKELGIDLNDCYFYTDSVRDIPTLEAVGHPCPVNPDFYLRRLARKRGWTIEYFSHTLGHDQVTTPQGGS